MINIPTTAELYEDILADLEAEYGESIPAFGKVFLRAIAGVQAAKLKLYYLAIANIQKNIFVDTADPEASGGTLERFGRIKLGRNPFPATAAQYEIEVTGTIGAVIDSLTTFKSDDDSTNPGKLYILDTTFTLASSPDTLVVRALEAGLDSQLDVGDTMTATIPIANVDKQAEVVSESVTPLAEEDIEDYRVKALNAYRTEAQGGAGADYRLWAADAQGVLQVYPFAKEGYANEVDVFVEATTEDSTDGKGTPSALILENVAEVIELDPDTTKPINERGRRPLTVFIVHCLPVVPLDVEITINDFTDVTVDEQTSIENSIEELINSIRPFVASIDILSGRNDLLDKNKIIAAIFSAKPGAVFGTIDLVVDGSPVTSYLFEGGEIPYLDSVTFS
jgi:uncharacterized phage protein gp47/JayE